MAVLSKPILVTGATGQQGGAVAKALLAKGQKVRVMTKNPEKAASCSRHCAKEGTTSYLRRTVRVSPGTTRGEPFATEYSNQSRSVKIHYEEYYHLFGRDR